MQVDGESLCFLPLHPLFLPAGKKLPAGKRLIEYAVPMGRPEKGRPFFMPVNGWTGAPRFLFPAGTRR